MEMPGERPKHAWRAEILARRRALDPAERDRENVALVAAVRTVDLPEWVCAYVPVRGEPGSTAMLEALRAAGARVLLPVTGEPGPLSWGEFTDPRALHAARWGLLEPDGPVLAPDAIGRAGLVLVPALAVDRRGVRLGRGAGHYDRSLGAVAPDATLMAVVRDEEVLASLPEEPHDIRMAGALTPFGGWQRFDPAHDRHGPE